MEMAAPCRAWAHEPMKPPESCGTTLVACEFDGGVVIGADSRTSAGALIVNRVSDKLTRVADTIYACRSGSSADTQAITDVVQYHLDLQQMIRGEKATVKMASEVFRGLCYEYRDDFSAGLLIAGWDEKLGGQVYSIPIGGMVVRRRCTAGGSGGMFIAGYLDRHFEEGMTLDQAHTFVREAVSLAMSRDGSSGGVIRIGTITEKGLERTLLTGPEIPQFFNDD